MKTTKEYSYSKPGKEIKVVYTYEKKVTDKIVDADGDRINLGTEIIERSEAELYMNGKLATRDRDIYEVTELTIRLASTPGVKVGMLRIGGVYISGQDDIDAIKKMVAEAKAEGTTEEAAEKEAADAKAAEVEKIKKYKRIIELAEKQHRIPTKAEYEKMQEADRDGIVTPFYVTKELLETAKKYLESVEA